MAYKFNPFTGKLDNTGPSVSALNVLGTVANEAALPGSATTGDVYQAEDTGVFYVWDGSAWDNLGTLAGPQGPTGATGPTGPAGADGTDGTDGTDGADGADGADGVGVPVGGTTNQVLAKASNTDYDTQWVDQTGGGGTPGGTTGQIQFNDDGSFGGATGSIVDSSGNVTIGGLTTLAGSPSANNTSGVLINGTWRTGASSNNPQLLLNPSGTTLSTSWSTSGTGIGVNAASGFGGNLLDLQVNGSSRFLFQGGGDFYLGLGTAGQLRFSPSALNTIYASGSNIHISTNGQNIHLGKISDINVGISISSVTGLLTANNGITIADAQNIATGTTTGTKIGTATTQKLGFYNATPVVQPTAVADADAATVVTQLNALLARMRNLGLIAT